MGCFWGAERKFWQTPGVVSTAAGYAGGLTPNPTYEEVCGGATGHAETVLVVYDPGRVGYDELLRVFWENHDPTQGMRQGNDIGTQYRSVVFYLDEAGQQWSRIENVTRNPENNTLSFETSHFSIYTIMGLAAPSGLSEVIAYPNPCYLKRDATVRIANIPLDSADTRIYLYSLAGELVRVLEEGNGIETLSYSKLGRWDGRNSDNEKVASGIYIYLIKSSQGKKTEKIAVFW
jgi:methionine-S-sulfoxide reductase